MSMRGFTLMEVLVALTLVAILVVALGGLSASQLAASVEADRLLAAEWLAENEMNRILAAREPIALGRQARVVSVGDRDYQLVSVASGTDVALLRRVEIAVGTVDAAGQEQRTLASLVGFRGLH